MAVYRYTAVDANLALARSTVVADTPRSARDKLREQGLVVQQIEPATGNEGPGLWQRWLDHRQRGKVVGFVTELSTLLAVGIPLLEALDTVARNYRGRFKAAVLEVRDQVAGGMGLAAAMRQRPKLFDELTINLVEVGENAGTLDESLQRLADFKQRLAQLKGRIGTALIYPAIVLTLAIGVTLFLMTYVVPQLLGSLTRTGQEVPAVTAAVKAISDFLLNWWWLLGGGLIAALFAIPGALRYGAVRSRVDRLVLKLPVLGNLLRKQAVARIAVIVATLMRSGVEFLQALAIARRTTGNVALRQALSDCEQAVRAGSEIASAMEKTDAFPPTVLQVFAVGQQSGQLEAMLDRLGADYDQQVNLAAQRLTAVLEPLLIIAMVTMVGFIAFATVLPMLEAGHVLQN
jgi:type II secretory pathway component PulF